VRADSRDERIAVVSQLIYDVIMGNVTQTTTMIHIRIDPDLKARASRTLDAMGLSLSEAVRVFLTRVATDQAIPFDLRVPNAQTVAAMEAGDRGEVVKFGSVEELMADLHADD